MIDTDKIEETTVTSHIDPINSSDHSDEVIEIDALRYEARELGIKFSMLIKAESLKKRIYDFKHKKPKKVKVKTYPKRVFNKTPETIKEDIVKESAASEPTIKLKSKAQEISEIIKACNKLVRVRVICMNPNKSAYQGEVFTASNSVVPTIKKFVPFDTEDGWHVPQLILNVMLERKCQLFKNVKTAKGISVKRGFMVPEFNIEYLDPLTEAQLSSLAKNQAAARNVD